MCQFVPRKCLWADQSLIFIGFAPTDLWEEGEVNFDSKQNKEKVVYYYIVDNVKFDRKSVVLCLIEV